ncbi:Cysteine-rich membrane protein 2 [Spironucleus salmonicida]|uniref:Cysteine-rich membrane protein 2 n=1 Tax=Spironucleus salmonicida TaxID=348837 RepID=A0A9P8LWX8_9EUKA|nr:Cysteine-rich membrane protein 2 [Spironucleus salmonicida]
MGNVAGTCSSIKENCGSPYYCPLIHDPETACLLCDPDQPIGTSCRCGAKYNIKLNCAGCDGESCSSCTHGYFFTDGTCNICISNCLICSGPLNCSQCLNGYFETPERCLPCAASMEIGGKCQCGNAKLENCAECNGNSCAKCRSEFKLISGGCIKDQCQSDADCAKSEFCAVSPSEVNLCKACGSMCQSCTENENKCLSCKNGMFLDQNVCKTCGTSIAAGVQCQCGDILVDNCGKCGDNVCEICVSGFRLEADKCTLCSEEQQLGRYCTCQGFSITNCISCDDIGCSACKTPLTLKGQVCLADECLIDSECKRGQFCQTSSIVTNACVTCADSCDQCAGSAENCISCGPNKFLVNAVCINCSFNQEPGAACNCGLMKIENCGLCGDNVCNSCINGYRPDSNACVACSITQPIGSSCDCQGQGVQNCVSCDSTGCRACLGEFKLIQRECVADECQTNEECVKGQFCQISANLANLCEKCSETCETCQTSANNCLSCKTDSYLQENQCQTCAFSQPLGKICTCGSANVENCGQCMENICKACIENYSLQGTACVLCQNSLPIGSSCTCQGLQIPNCAKCNDSGCAECVLESQLVNGVCVQNLCSESVKCPTGQICEILPGKPNVCKVCTPNCQQCSMVGSCDLCQSDFFKNGVACTRCVEISSEECNCAGTMIKQCAICDKDQCSLCAIGAIFRDGACVSCSEMQLGGVCNCGKLVANCVSCDSNGGCGTCLDGLKNVDGQCVDCTKNPELCKTNLGTNQIIYIVLGVIAGVCLIIGIVIVVKIVKKRKSIKSDEYNSAELLTRNNSSSQIY